VLNKENEMTVSAMEREITREGVPPFLIDGSVMIDGPSTRCLQQLWCSPQALDTTATLEAQSNDACDTSCLRQLGLARGFAPLVD
jgi:hypothetical protein